MEPLFLAFAVSLSVADRVAVEQASAQAETARVRKALERPHPLSGASPAAVRQLKGPPSEILANGRVWIYWHSFGPGAHSFQLGTEFRFSNNRVSRVEETQRPVGCILVMPERPGR